MAKRGNPYHDSRGRFTSAGRTGRVRGKKVDLVGASRSERRRAANEYKRSVHGRVTKAFALFKARIKHPRMKPRVALHVVYPRRKNGH